MAVASHGRGFWILDDLHLLRQLAEFEGSGGAHLFATKDTLRMPGPKETSGKATAGVSTSVGKKYRIALETPATYYETPRPGHKPRRLFLNAGQNPEEGVAFDYFLESPAQSASLSILDSQGRVAVSCLLGFRRHTPSPPAQGINRFVWDMHYPPGIKLPGDKTTEDDVASGPLAPPGLYKVRLDVDGAIHEEQFRIVKDPNSAVTDDDLVAQFDLLMQVHAKVSETHLGLIRLRSISEQVARWRERALGMGAEEAVSTADENTGNPRRCRRAARPDPIQGRQRPPPLSRPTQQETLRAHQGRWRRRLPAHRPGPSRLPRYLRPHRSTAGPVG